MTPQIEVVTFHNLNELCSGLTGWSANNESNGSQDSTGKREDGNDPEFGIAGSKKYDVWNSWDEE